MLVSDRNRHWCQADYATTCLVKALRKEAGLTTKTTTDYLAKGFETRGGLFFANPYMADWALALALEKDESGEELKQKLLAEILASINDDYSFGAYDIALSTAFAILSLGILGCRDKILRLAQLRLLEFIDPQGNLPLCTPFYSTIVIPQTLIPSNQLLRLSLKDHRKQFVEIEGKNHGISYYDDSHKMIITALVALALAEKCDPSVSDPNVTEMTRINSHPRYQCLDHSEYVTKFALSPYLSTTVYA